MDFLVELLQLNESKSCTHARIAVYPDQEGHMMFASGADKNSKLLRYDDPMHKILMPYLRSKFPSITAKNDTYNGVKLNHQACKEIEAACKKAKWKFVRREHHYETPSNNTIDAAQKILTILKTALGE